MFLKRLSILVMFLSLSIPQAEGEINELPTELAMELIRNMDDAQTFLRMSQTNKYFKEVVTTLISKDPAFKKEIIRKAESLISFEPAGVIHFNKPMSLVQVSRDDTELMLAHFSPQTNQTALLVKINLKNRKVTYDLIHDVDTRAENNEAIQIRVRGDNFEEVTLKNGVFFVTRDGQEAMVSSNLETVPSGDISSLKSPTGKSKITCSWAVLTFTPSCDLQVSSEESGEWRNRDLKKFLQNPTAKFSFDGKSLYVLDTRSKNSSLYIFRLTPFLNSGYQPFEEVQIKLPQKGWMNLLKAKAIQQLSRCRIM